MSLYEKINYNKLEFLEKKHKWIVEPIYKASTYVKNMPFYVGDEYFDVHVEADEHHSIMGLDYITQYEADSERGKVLIAKALEGIELWASMIHSWIGIYTYPKFDLNGNLIENHQC